MGTAPPPVVSEVAIFWIILSFAGLFKVGWVIDLKCIKGFSKPLPAILAAFAMLISLGLLGLVTRHLLLGIAYVVWAGAGAVGAVIAGIVLLGESMVLPRLASVTLTVCGLASLKLNH